jgi:hypothetical protein
MKGEFSNGLTPAQLERLAFLSEELGEAQQAIGKIVRHGYDSYNPLVLTNSNNREDLEKEIGLESRVQFARSAKATPKEKDDGK